MKKVRKFLVLAVIFNMIAMLLGLGGVLNNALASESASLIIENAKHESITVGSVSVSSSGDNLLISFRTDNEFPLFFTSVTFRGNSGDVNRALSTGRTEFLTDKSDHHHGFSIPRSKIDDDVTIFASADVIVNGKVTHTKKAFVSVQLQVPEKVTTTTEERVTTTERGVTTTEAPATTTTEVPVTTTEVPVTTTEIAVPTTVAPVTTETVAPVTTITTVLPVTTVPPVPTTIRPVIERERLPITGIDYNWYLIGSVLVLLGTAVYLGSAQKSN